MPTPAFTGDIELQSYLKEQYHLHRDVEGLSKAESHQMAFAEMLQYKELRDSGQLNIEEEVTAENPYTEVIYSEEGPL